MVVVMEALDGRVLARTVLPGPGYWRDGKSLDRSAQRNPKSAGWLAHSVCPGFQPIIESYQKSAIRPVVRRHS